MCLPRAITRSQLVLPPSHRLLKALLILQDLMVSLVDIKGVPCIPKSTSPHCKQLRALKPTCRTVLYH